MMDGMLLLLGWILRLWGVCLPGMMDGMLLFLGWILRLWGVCLPGMMDGMAWVECWVDWLLFGWVQWGAQQPVAWMLGPAFYLGKESLRPKRCLHLHHPA
jgi:hypothetical protein